MNKKLVDSIADRLFLELHTIEISKEEEQEIIKRVIQLSKENK